MMATPAWAWDDDAISLSTLIQSCTRPSEKLNAACYGYVRGLVEGLRYYQALSGGTSLCLPETFSLQEAMSLMKSLSVCLPTPAASVDAQTNLAAEA